MPQTTANGAQSLLSMISSGSPGSNAPQASVEKQHLDNVVDIPAPAVSRFFPNPPNLSPNGSQNNDRQHVDLPASTSASSFNPPPGSRLLAFASRGPANPSPNLNAQLKAPGALETTLMQTSMVPGVPGPNASKIVVADASPNFAADYQYVSNPRVTPPEATFVTRSYSPFGQTSQASFLYDEVQDSRLGPNNDTVRRTSGLPPPNQFNPSPEAGSPYQELGSVMPNAPGNGPAYDLGGNPAGANYAAGKGSRFAKFFDAKRDIQASAGIRRPSVGAGFPSTSPHPGQRQESLALNGLGTVNPESRTMEDIFAMLQNSAQVCPSRCLTISFPHSQVLLSRIIVCPHRSVNRTEVQVAVRPSFKDMLNCRTSNFNSFISSSMPTIGWSPYTKVVSMTETSCQTAWCPVFDQYHARAAGSHLVCFSMSTSMIHCSLVFNVCLNNSLATSIRCTPARYITNIRTSKACLATLGFIFNRLNSEAAPPQFKALYLIQAVVCRLDWPT